jgi:hypothetical protein
MASFQSSCLGVYESSGIFLASWHADIRNSNSFAPLHASDDISPSSVPATTC